MRFVAETTWDDGEIITGEKAWQRCVAAQGGDAYGLTVCDYAERWADLMEPVIDERGIEHLPDIAEVTNHEADTDGITGFMYGCAVGMLARVWIYGEELRHWHNLETQLGDEGERANENGGTLNPALLNINL